MSMNTWGKSLATAMSIALLASVSACASEPQETYETVDDLKHAFVDAGGECNGWIQDNKVLNSQQSGSCGDFAVLSVYLSQEAVERRVEETKNSIFGTVGGDWLVGENWIINDKDPARLQEQLGGRVVSFASE